MRENLKAQYTLSLILSKIYRGVMAMLLPGAKGIVKIIEISVFTSKS